MAQCRAKRKGIEIKALKSTFSKISLVSQAIIRRKEKNLVSSLIKHVKHTNAAISPDLENLMKYYSKFLFYLF